MKNLIEAARTRCREKPGCTRGNLYDEDYKILDGFLDSFARMLLDRTPAVLLLRVPNDRREQLAASGANIRISEELCWEQEGWLWADVGLDGSISWEILQTLIDESYQLARGDLYEHKQLQLDLLTRALPPKDLLAELIKAEGLSRKREEIEKLARPALLMRTTTVKEEKLALGETKIGGRPDLPADVPWPTCDDRPLAFLAQVNFAGIKLAGAPKSGIVALFSVYGWQSDEEADPQLPPGEPTAEWTQAIYIEGDAPLERRRTPKGVTTYPAARVDYVPIISLPTDRREPEVAKLGWSKAIGEKYESMVASFNGACGHTLGNPPRHLLLGHADYEQQFVGEVAQQNLRLLLQLATDGNTGMCWGDGGFLYFWIRQQDLTRRKFHRLYTDYQCG